MTHKIIHYDHLTFVVPEANIDDLLDAYNDKDYEKFYGLSDIVISNGALVKTNNPKGIENEVS